MGCCGFLLRLTGYFLVAFLGVLTYFHFTQCVNEKTRPDFAAQFDPKVTDVEVSLPFSLKGAVNNVKIGAIYILTQSCPCALTKLVKFLEGEPYPETDFKNVTIFDARKHKPGSFEKTGFALIELENEPDISDYRTPVSEQFQSDGEIKKLHLQLEPHIKRYEFFFKKSEHTEYKV